MNLLDRSLPKWPEMRTIGAPITPKQARNIIMRTDACLSYFSGNNREWLSAVANIIGLKYSEKYPNYEHDDLEKIRNKINFIYVEYIMPDRISSSYIGGPNGWVDWNGNIGESGHNIGKWPDVKTVFEEWGAIANAFPFLDMRCQLFDKEGCEDNSNAVIEYVIKNGEVNVVEPADIIPQTIPKYRNFLDLNSEIGVSEEVLRLAFQEAISSKTT